MHPTLVSLIPLLALISASPIAERKDTGSLISSGRYPDLCLSIEGGLKAVVMGQITNGTPVVSIPCGEASYWDIGPGSGSVIVSGVSGTAFALDIGLEPGNHGGIKVWQSYPGAPQQAWYFTPDSHLAHTGGNQCLDQGDDRVQTYRCASSNINQIWNVAMPVPLPIPTTATSTSPVITSMAPDSKAATDIATGKPTTTTAA